VTAHPEAALWTLLESTTEAEVHRLPQVVAQLTQPAYFIAGNQDSVMEPRYVRHLASFHPLFDMSGENLREIPDCGHMGMVEQPIPIAQEIKTILQRHGVDRWLQNQPEALKNV
jgi:pimeloyl-ACP methyl ester carboxylesterase